MEAANMTELQHSMLFKGMSEADIRGALDCLSSYEQSYRKDELILIAGDTTDAMGFVLSGSVTIEMNDMWGNRTILSHVGKGQYFAETYATLPGETLLVDVRANENCRILFIRTADIYTMNDRNKQWLLPFIRNLLRISLRKNLVLSGHSFYTAPKSARARIMSYLNAVSLQKHSTEFDIPYDRQQMADYLNLERTALSKELGKMKSEGLIEYRKNHFKLLETDPF